MHRISLAPFCVAATGAWYVLRGIFAAEARVMLRMGLYFAAVLVPAQLIFGHLNGEYVVHHQPAKMAAIEARWHDEKPASEVLLAWPDVGEPRNLFAITLPPPFGSLIDSDSPSAGEVGLDSIPPQNWPPVAIPFFSFRIMVGCWVVMLLIAWVGSYLIHKERIEQNRLLLWAAFLSFPLPFIAILTGWVTAEVGRQPWVVYGVLRTADAMTPFLTARRRRSRWLFIASSTASFSRSEPTTSIGCCALDRKDAWFCPRRRSSQPPDVGRRRAPAHAGRSSRRRGRIAMVMFWVAILAVSILLYVLLDGFDLGVGMLFGLTRRRDEAAHDVERGCADLGRQRDLACRRRVVLWGAFPVVYATLLSAFYLPLLLMLAGLILRGVAFEYRNKTERLRWIWDAGFAGGSACRCLHARHDRRRLGGGAADCQRSIHRRRIRLV